MADSFLSDLTASAPLDGTELVYGTKGGADRKLTTAQIAGLGVPDLAFGNRRDQSTLLPRWQLAKAARLAGVRDARILAVGDSTTFGSGGNGSLLANNGKSLGWPSLLANLVSGGSNRSVVGNGHVNAINSYPAFDTRVNPGSFALSGGSARSLGGFTYTATSAATFAWTPGVAFDLIDVYYLKITGGGTFNVSVDAGASLQSVNTNAASALGKVTVSCTQSTGTVNLAWASGQVWLVGVATRLSSAKEVSIINAGQYSSVVADHVVTTNPYSTLNAIPAMTPDLVVVGLTINDNATGTAAATYQSQLQTLVTASKSAGADVIMITGNPVDTALVAQTTQQTYVDLFKAIAATNNVPVVDIFTLYGDYATANGRGLMYDQRHPTATGYGIDAGMIHRPLLAA